MSSLILLLIAIALTVILIGTLDRIFTKEG